MNTYHCQFHITTALILFVAQSVSGQPNPFYSNLPIGKYPIGFNIVTLTDSSRVTKPLYNYFGEKETGDRHKKISIHVWYPAKNNTGKGLLTYGDYSYMHLLESTNEKIDEKKKSAMQNNYRNYFEGFFGKIADTDWTKLKESKFLAQREAEPVHEKFPLLMGTLRPLSTSVTNEFMASNGYVVAMVLNSGGRQLLSYITDVSDMQHAFAYLNKTGRIDENTIGTYGFSGPGFAQVLLAMNDPRIGALADIESALYGERIWEIFSSSNYFDISKLKVPFLHIYGKKLAQADTHFEQFYKKKYSDRYHLLLNDPSLHHWDVATEGRASTTVIHIRGEHEAGIKASFELSNIYMLHFFNAILKMSPVSKKIIDDKSNISGYPDTLRTIQQYPAIGPPPDKAQFEEIQTVERNRLKVGNLMLEVSSDIL